MSRVGAPAGSPPSVRYSPLDAAREIGLATLAGCIGGVVLCVLTDLALRSRVASLAAASVFGLPVLIVAGWVVVGVRRRAAWRERRVWASIGLALGNLVLLPALFAGFWAAKQLAMQLFGYPPY